MRNALPQSRDRAGLRRRLPRHAPLIVGCGNCDRGDDAAGRLVAEKLRALGISAIDCSGDFLALMELWRTADDVILVDAVTTGAPLGTIHEWNAEQLKTECRSVPSTHGLGLPAVIELARRLHALPRRLRIFGIESRNFKIANHASPEVLESVHGVTERILQELEIAATQSPRS